MRKLTPIEHAALGLVAMLALVLVADALGDDPPGAERPSDAVLASAYPRLHDAAERSPRAHAGRDVLDDGRARDGRLSWALVRAEARRLWDELHPVRERLTPAWWIDAAAGLRWCESRGDPTVVDASGTYGGLYQFDLSTWQSVGGQGRPEQASVDEQHHRAYLLWQRRGWQPWPVCG